MSAVMADQALYLPQLGRISKIEALTPREKYFRVELERPLGHGPGQFVMVSIPGVGRAPSPSPVARARTMCSKW